MLARNDVRPIANPHLPTSLATTTHGLCISWVYSHYKHITVQQTLSDSNQHFILVLSRRSTICRNASAYSWCIYVIGCRHAIMKWTSKCRSSASTHILWPWARPQGLRNVPSLQDLQSMSFLSFAELCSFGLLGIVFFFRLLGVSRAQRVLFTYTWRYFWQTCR